MACGGPEKQKSFELKLADLRALELRYDETKAQRETEFQNQAVQANQRILEDIFTVTKGIGEKEGFNLILNATKLNLSLCDVVFTRNVDDITDRARALLNAAKPVLAEPGSVSEPKEQP